MQNLIFFALLIPFLFPPFKSNAQLVIYTDSAGNIIQDSIKAQMARMNKDTTNTRKPGDLPPHAMTGKQIPDLTFKTIEGTVYKTSRLEGKVVLLNFWKIQCPPCMYEIPVLNRVDSAYKGKDFILLSCALNGEEELKRFNDSNDRESYKVLKQLANGNVVQYPIVPNAGKICKKSEVNSYPTTFFIDKSGEVHKVKTGFGISSGDQELTNNYYFKQYSAVIDSLLLE